MNYIISNEYYLECCKKDIKITEFEKAIRSHDLQILKDNHAYFLDDLPIIHDTFFLTACATSNLKIVDYIINIFSINVNCVDDDDNTGLILSIIYNPDFEVFKYLIQNTKISIYEYNKECISCFHYAVILRTYKELTYFVMILHANFRIYDNIIKLKDDRKDKYLTVEQLSVTQNCLRLATTRNDNLEFAAYILSAQQEPHNLPVSVELLTFDIMKRLIEKIINNQFALNLLINKYYDHCLIQNTNDQMLEFKSYISTLNPLLITHKILRNKLITWNTFKKYADQLKQTVTIRPFLTPYQTKLSITIPMPTTVCKIKIGSKTINYIMNCDVDTLLGIVYTVQTNKSTNVSIRKIMTLMNFLKYITNTVTDEIKATSNYNLVSAIEHCIITYFSKKHLKYNEFMKNIATTYHLKALYLSIKNQNIN